MYVSARGEKLQHAVAAASEASEAITATRHFSWSGCVTAVAAQSQDSIATSELGTDHSASNVAPSCILAISTSDFRSMGGKCLLMMRK
jgi:hypothetical protein